MQTKRIKQELVYPAGANTPTHRNEYECPCGKGKIVEEYVPGFDDRCVTLECEECKKHYRIVEGHGSIWDVVPTEK